MIVDLFSWGRIVFLLQNYERGLNNNFKESYEYYSDNKLKTLINKDASGNVIEKYTYTYDSALYYLYNGHGVQIL